MSQKIGRLSPAHDHELRCVIIAAGRGSRLADRAASKPLLEVAGKPLIDRTIDAARRAGLKEFVVVTGFAGDEVEEHLRAKAAAEGIVVATVRNEEWEKENGLSVLKSRALAGPRFLLMVADHIFGPGLLDGLSRQAIGEDEVILAVDRRLEGHPHVDLDDVTRVRDAGGHIVAIGKNIADYNAFDTGAFLCTSALFSALEASQGRGDYSLSSGIRLLAEKSKARTWTIGETFWIDVDDERALRRAEEAIASGLADRRPAVHPPKRSWKGTQILLSGAGVLLFIYLLLRVGTGTVLVHLARFGPWFLVILALAFAWIFAQACAWRLVQTAYFRPVPLLRLFRTRIISDSLNTLIPSANVGGDAARAFLIKRHVPLTEGIPGVLVDKTIEFSASTFFLMTGFLLSLLFLELPGWMMGAAAVCLGITVIGIVLLILFQLKGVLWTLGRIAKIVPRVRGFMARRETQIKELDANLRLVYRRFDPRVAAAAALHYLGRLFGVAEVYVILRVLDANASFIQALFTSTGVTIINTAFFFVPGNFGIMESAHVLILRSLGFSAAMGLSLGVIRRIRKLATAGIGLLLFALRKEK
jgi:1L-myo-inositol 1-phosphate cytidylyltransferase